MPTAKKLPSGSWRVQAYSHTDPVTGKKVYRSFVAPTAKEANFLAAEFYLTKHKKTDCAKTSLQDAYAMYINSKSNVLSPNTIREYKRSASADFQELMHLPIEKITYQMVQNAINKEAMRCSPKTVRNKFGLFSAVVGQFGVKFETRGAGSRISLPQTQKKSIKVPTQEEINKIYPVVQGTVMEVPFLLASQLGLRAGEIAGLKLSDVDPENNTISIRRSLAYTGERFVLKQPKTYAGTRAVPCHKQIIDILLNTTPYKEIVPGEDLLIGLHTNDITHRWEHILKAAGIERFNFHALRHYFASQALLQNMPRRYVAELMGHGSSKMLDQVYEHTFAAEKNKMSEKMVVLSDILFKSNE